MPRPGVPAEVQIGLVGGGDIEGAMMKSGELGFEGLDLELVDAGGKVAHRAHRFRRLLPVRPCRLRHLHDPDQRGFGAAAKFSPDLGLAVEITPDRSVVRLGSIQAKAASASRSPTSRPRRPDHSWRPINLNMPRHVGCIVMVRSRKLELPRPFGHSDLNAARLPVPPRPHVMKRPAEPRRHWQGAASSKGGGRAQWRPRRASGP